MINGRLSLLLAALVAFGAGCIQKVDSGLASGGATAVTVDWPDCPPDQGFACHFPIATQTPPIGLDHDPVSGDVTMTTAPGSECNKVTLDVLSTFGAKCNACHGGTGASGMPLTFILNIPQLLMAKSSIKYKFQPYIVPGDPDASLIYQRAVLVRDMPMPPGYLTISEASNLRQWIQSCTIPGNASPPVSNATGGATGATDGTSGSGGAGGLGGRSSGGASSGGRSSGGASSGGASSGGASSGGASSGGASSGGASSGGAGGGAPATGAPCDGICPGAVPFTSPPAYSAQNIAAGAVGCYETSSALSTFMCGSANGRQFTINRMNVMCGAAVPTNTIPARNGGYCIRVTQGGNAGAFFTAN